MPLKTFVKVGSISNLSDARYCAGMGVDMLGFGAIEGGENYIKASQFQEIRGWINGPLIVAEIYGIADPKDLATILEHYKPDYLEMGLQELALFTSLPRPFMLSIDDDDSVDTLTLRPDYAISNRFFECAVPLLVRIQSVEDVKPLLESHAVKGIVLKGGSELKPGLKDFEVVNEVLEFLEIED